MKLRTPTLFATRGVHSFLFLQLLLHCFVTTAAADKADGHDGRDTLPSTRLNLITVSIVTNPQSVHRQSLSLSKIEKAHLPSSNKGITSHPNQTISVRSALTTDKSLFSYTVLPRRNLHILQSIIMQRSMPLTQKVLCLSEEAVKTCLDMKECLRVNRQAFVDLAQNKVVVPPRVAIPYHDPHHGSTGGDDASDFSLFKPAAIPDRNLMAIKLVSTRQHNPSHGLPLVPATVVSIDPPSGRVNGLVAGTYLTGARTTTGSALSTALYRPDMERLVVMGAGLQARLHIQAISTALERPIQHVTIVNRTLSRAQDLAAEITEQHQGWAERIDSLALHGPDPLLLAEVLSRADVIVTTTNTTTPLFTDSTPLKPGCHICSVGSFTPQMQEIPARVVDQCTVIIDTNDARSVGDLKHLTDHHPVHLLGNILHHDDGTPPRDERMSYTFFKSVGTAVQDVYTTNMVMERAREKGLGTEIEL